MHLYAGGCITYTPARDRTQHATLCWFRVYDCLPARCHGVHGLACLPWCGLGLHLHKRFGRWCSKLDLLLFRLRWIGRINL